MKRQQETVGSIVQIHINDEFYVYAQILPHGLLAFFDYKSDTELSDLNVLKNAKVLFITAVYKYVITKGIWLKVGKIPIREDLQVLPLRFVYDRIREKFFTYNPETGETAPTTIDVAKKLERAAVWDDKQIEERIKNHYDGVPCKWMQETFELFNMVRGKKTSISTDTAMIQLMELRTLLQQRQYQSALSLLRKWQDFTIQALKI